MKFRQFTHHIPRGAFSAKFEGGVHITNWWCQAINKLFLSEILISQQFCELFSCHTVLFTNLNYHQGVVDGRNV